MTPKVVAVRLLSGYTLHLRFADGTEGDLDLAGELWGPVFEPLKDPARFAEVRVHPELHTLVWPNGADFAPEFLYAKVRVAA
ncbi:MAG: DUF2442 domain-containing protein [Thermoanaerobaculia bacterium]|nr:DUF2442 domain-containing protein [Thermoanaerobaculia bacterium]MCZ7650348.1 DUF2442 domain-containing protein [Thermoanaerobaculia bacterium]